MQNQDQIASILRATVQMQKPDCSYRSSSADLLQMLSDHVLHCLPFVSFGCILHSKTKLSFLACLDEVQEELLYYPRLWRRRWWCRRHLQTVKVFYVMGKGLSGELSCPCDRSCLAHLSMKCSW